MILRRYYSMNIPLFVFLLSCCVHFTRADEFDCHPTLEGSKYDFTTLGGEHVVNRTRDRPPSTMIDSLTFDLCGDLQAKEGLDEYDQCPTGTRACLTRTSVRPNEGEWILTVVPLAQTAKLDPKLSVSPASPRYLSLLLHGSEYPQSTSTPSTPQSLNITLWCDPQIEEPNITIEAYDGSRLDLVYVGPAGCPLKSEDGGSGDDKSGGGEDKKEESVGSGLGFFFLVLLLALMAYFSLGAYYNYSTYGARGVDLIPHRDFWQEVPYMLKDVVSHLCSSARPRRSTRGGYISV